jgi:hypothetical protein
VSVLPGTWYPRPDTSYLTGYIVCLLADTLSALWDISSAQDTVSSYPDSLSARTSSLLGDIQYQPPGTEYSQAGNLSQKLGIWFSLQDTSSLWVDIQYQPPGTVYPQADNLLKTPDISSSQQGTLFAKGDTLSLKVGIQSLLLDTESVQVDTS